jgi:hypothetical protein
MTVRPVWLHVAGKLVGDSRQETGPQEAHVGTA